MPTGRSARMSKFGWDLSPAVLRGKTLAKSSDYTVQAQDSGYLIEVSGTDTTITLPATVIGYCVTIRCSGARKSSNGADVVISPNANDKIVGLGAAGVDNKDLYLDGDESEVTLLADGNVGWYIMSGDGTISRES